MKFAMSDQIIQKVFSELSLLFVRCEHTNSNSPVCYESVDLIPDYKQSKYGQPFDNSYLLILPGNEVLGREIRLKDGGRVWAWDNLLIDSAVINFGGIYLDRHIIGDVSVQGHMSNESKEIFKNVRKRIKLFTINRNGVHISDDVLNGKNAISFSSRINPVDDFKY